MSFLFNMNGTMFHWSPKEFGDVCPMIFPYPQLSVYYVSLVVVRLLLCLRV